VNEKKKKKKKINKQIQKKIKKKKKNYLKKKFKKKVEISKQKIFLLLFISSIFLQQSQLHLHKQPYYFLLANF
jgi:hypothetical protein